MIWAQPRNWARVLSCAVPQDLPSLAGGGNVTCSCQAVEREVWQQNLWEQLLESLLSGTWICVSTPFQGKGSILGANWPVWLALRHIMDMFTLVIWLASSLSIWHILQRPSLVALQWFRFRAVWLQETWTIPLKLYQDFALGVLPFNYWASHERCWFL